MLAKDLICVSRLITHLEKTAEEAHLAYNLSLGSPRAESKICGREALRQILKRNVHTPFSARHDSQEDCPSRSHTVWYLGKERSFLEGKNNPHEKSNIDFILSHGQYK